MQELDLMRLYDTSKNFIKVIADPIETKIEYDIKLDDKVLTFKTMDSEPIANEHYIDFYGQQWVVKATRRDGQFIEITAKHNIEELSGNVFNFIKVTSLTLDETLLTIFNAANNIFPAFPWTYALSANLLTETAILSKRRTVDVAQITMLEAIEEVLRLWFLEVEFDTLNKQVIFHNKRGGNKGVYFSSQLNLRKIDLEIDTYDYATRLIPIGKDDLRISDVNSGVPYVSNYTYSNKVITKFWIDNRYTSKTNMRDDAILKLAELALPLRVYACDIVDLSTINPMFSYEIGDTVTIMNEQLGIKDVQRIMKMTVYPYDPETNTAELANRRGTFEELQNQILDSREMIDVAFLANGQVNGFNVIGINKNFIEIETDVDGITTEIGQINEEINEVVTYARGIILSNESQSFAVGSDGLTSLAFTPIYTRVGTYQAGNRIASTIGTIEFFTSANVPITLPVDSTIGFINPTVSEDGEISIILPQGTDLITRSGYIRVPITISGTMYIKRLYWSTVEVGDDIVGLDGITVILTNESDTIATAFDGTGGDYSNVNTYVQVFVGIINDTANWTFTALPSNVTGAFDSIELNKYQVTNMTAPKGYVDITATKGATSIVKRFTLAQARAGSNGTDGLDGTDGADGLAGLNQATVYLYQRKSGTAPVISDIGTTVYTFATTGLTGTIGAWSRTIPSGTNPIYVTVASAVSSSATASLAPSAWATPVVIAQNGTDGSAGSDGFSGLSSAIVFIYQRAEIAPALPSATSTYTFSTAGLTGLNNGWTKLVPASNGFPLWVTQATATATAPTDTDTILSSEWAPASILSEDGAQGEVGPSYWLTVDSSFIPVDEFGSYKVNQVTVSGYSASSSTINDYFGRFTIEALSKTTNTWNTVYTSVSDESSKVYTIGTNVASLRFIMYESGGIVNILDSQTVPMVYDGLSNRYVAISSTSQIFQSDDGGINFSPGDIYLTPVMLNATFDKWQFSVDGETFVDLPLSYPAYQIPLAYEVGDIVSYNSIAYQCIVAHTSASATLDVLIVPNAWAESTSYVLNDVVEFNGAYYKALGAHTSTASFSADIANWESITRKWVVVIDVTQVTRDDYPNVLKVPSNSALFLYGGELTFNVLFRVFVNYTIDSVSYSAFDTVTIARTFNSTELVNVITQTYATRLDSLEKFETEVGERIYYGEAYQATNLVTNGDFSDGTTGWTALDSTLSATANTLSITGNGANASATARQTTTDAIVGNVYYIGFKARVTNTLCQSIGITYPFVNTMKSAPVQNTWYPLSAVGVATLTERLRIAHTYTSAANASGKVMEAKEVLILNLTQIFGVGSEPNKEEMDAIIAKFSTQWFSGTAPVLRDEPLVQNFTNWKQQIDNFLLGVQSGGGYNLIQNSVGYRDPNNSEYGWTLSGAGTVQSVNASQESFILASTSKNGFSFVGTKVISQEIPLIPNRQLSFAVKVNTQELSSGTVKVYARINGTDFYLVNRAHDSANPLNSTFQMNLSSSSATTCTIYIDTLNVVGEAYVTDLLLTYGNNVSEWQQATGEIYNLNVLIDRNGITVMGTEPNSYTNISPFEFAGYYQGNRIFTLNGSVTEVQEIRIKKAVGATETAMWIKPFRIVQTPLSLDFVWVGDTADE